MSDAVKALIFCGVMIYITGVFSAVIVSNNMDKSCTVTFGKEKEVHVMVGSWK